MDSFEVKLNDALNDTFNNIQKYEETALESFLDVPVTINEVHMIEVIGKHEGEASVGTIAAMLSITMPSATVAIQKLERKGFIEKKFSTEDARKSIISLTESGQKVNKAHDLFHRRMVRKISKEIPEDEKEILLSAITKLSDFFKEKVERL